MILPTMAMVRGVVLAYCTSAASKALPARTQAILKLASSQLSIANMAHETMEALWAVREQLDPTGRLACASSAAVIWSSGAFAKGDRAMYVLMAIRHDDGDTVALYDADSDPAVDPDFAPPPDEPKS